MAIPADLNPFSQAFAQALFARYPKFTGKRYPTTASENGEFFLEILEPHSLRNRLRKRLAIDTEGGLINVEFDQLRITFARTEHDKAPLQEVFTHLDDFLSENPFQDIFTYLDDLFNERIAVVVGKNSGRAYGSTWLYVDDLAIIANEYTILRDLLTAWGVDAEQTTSLSLPHTVYVRSWQKTHNAIYTLPTLYPDAQHAEVQLDAENNDLIITFETSATADQVRRFYAEELAKKGWRRGLVIPDQIIFEFPLRREGNIEQLRSLNVRTFSGEPRTRVQISEFGATTTYYDTSSES